ncbi:MAG: 30S ribosomal protein S27e [Thermoplasmatota archaeon]
MNRKAVSKFVKLKCADCENEQVVFNKAATEVRCLACGAVLAKPTGGLAELKGEVVEELA